MKKNKKDDMTKKEDFKKEEKKQNNNVELKENSGNKKPKIIPSYQKKNEPLNKKDKKKMNKKTFKSKITIAILIAILLLVGGAIFGIVYLVNYNRYKPYIKYEEPMQTYGFDKVYNNETAKTGDKVTKSEAIKMVLSAVLNTSDISGFAKEPDDNYTNGMWVEYAKFRGIISDEDITKDNADDKATYIEVIRYLANAKTKILEKDLDSKDDLKVKDIDKYKPDEQIAIEDMIVNEIITINTKKIKGNSHVFKGQINELISNFVVKYNTITVNGEKININEDRMPSNKDEYPYTLSSVDKSVYEKEFYVDDENNFKNPKEIYIVKKEYYTQIQEIAEGYYNTILNVDYNTINYDKMKDSILQYVLYGTDGLKEYVDYVKNNKIIIEGKSTVLFPTVYFDGLEYVVRMKLEFEIKSSNTKDNILYLDPIGNTNTKVKYDNNKYTVYIDAKMTNAFDGSDALYNDNGTIVDLLLDGQKDTMIRE